jgi:hypothetical protein
VFTKDGAMQIVLEEVADNSTNRNLTYKGGMVSQSWEAYQKSASHLVHCPFGQIQSWWETLRSVIKARPDNLNLPGTSSASQAD